MIFLKNVLFLCFIWLFQLSELVSCPETSAGGNENPRELHESALPPSPREHTETVNEDELFNEEALHHYTAAVEAHPSEWLYYRLRGLSYLKMKNFDMAIQNFKEAISRNPGGNVDHILLCLTLFDAKNFTGVTEELDKWTHSDLMTLGSVFQSRNKFQEAIFCYDAAIRKDPEAVIYYEKRATCHRKSGNVWFAILDYEKILSMAPEKWNYRISLAAALVETGHADKAINDILTNATEIAILGNKLSNTKKFKEALKCYNEAIRRESGNSDFHWKRGIIFLELKEIDEAISDLKQSIAISPMVFRRLFLIELLLDSRRFDEAMQEMVFVDHTHLYRLADLMFENKKYEQVLYCSNEAIKKAPENGKYYLLRGKCNQKMKNLNAAINDFKAVLRHDGDITSLNFWMDFCDILLDAGKYLDAKIILEKRIRKSASTDENYELRSEEFRKRIVEKTSKARIENLPVQKKDKELVKLLKSAGSTQPSTSERTVRKKRKRRGKNETDSSQLEPDTQAVEREDLQGEGATDETTTVTPRYSLRNRRKLSIDLYEPSTSKNTDSEDELLRNESNSKDSTSPRATSRRKRVSREKVNEFLQLAVTNMTKQKRTKAKRKKVLGKEKPNSTSEEERKRSTSQESEPLYWFADVILMAHDSEAERLANNAIKDTSNQFLESAVADPRIAETGPAIKPGQKWKTKSVDDLYGLFESETEVRSLERIGGEITDPHLIAQVWANQLRAMTNSRQRSIALNAINDILFEAEQGTLHQNAVKINTSTPDEQMEQ